MNKMHAIADDDIHVAAPSNFELLRVVEIRITHVANPRFCRLAALNWLNAS